MSNSPRKCLIVLTALRFTPEYGKAALESARERGEDVVLCLVIDPEISEAVADQLVEVGFLGEKLRHDLRGTMIAEYRERGLGYLTELLETAKTLSIQAESRVVDGSFVTTVLETADEFDVERVVVARVRQFHLSRIFFGGHIDELGKKSKRPVDVFDWTGAPVG